MLVLGSNSRMDIHAHRRKRLWELVTREADGNVAEYARKHDQNAERLRQVLNENYRKGKSFGEGTAERLVEELGLPPLYFDLGIEQELIGEHTSPGSDASINAPKGTMIKGLPKNSEISIKSSLETNVSEPLMLTAGRAVAVVGEVQGSPDGLISIDDYPERNGHGWIEIYTTDSSAYGMKVRGDGMRPRIKSGEHIVVEPGIEAQPGDDVVVKFTDGSAVVKELLWIRDGEACLGSISNATPPTTRAVDTILSIHRIAAIIPRGSGMYRAD